MGALVLNQTDNSKKPRIKAIGNELPERLTKMISNQNYQKVVNILCF